MDVASRTRSLSWPSELQWMPRWTAGARIPEGQSRRHLLSLTGCWPRLPELSLASFLIEPCPQPPRPSCARRKWGSGAFSPDAQASVCGCHRVVTWVSSHLSEWCSRFHDYCSCHASPARRDGMLAKGTHVAVSECGCGCFGRKGN